MTPDALDQLWTRLFEPGALFAIPPCVSTSLGLLAGMTVRTDSANHLNILLRLSFVADPNP